MLSAIFNTPTPRRSARGMRSTNSTGRPIGLTAGAGFAYAFTNAISAKFEYRYTQFNGYNRPGSALTGLTANGQLPYTTNSSFSVVSVGLDFKFGGPVVAKY